MDHAVWVDIDVNAGSNIVEALDAAGVNVNVAILATFPEYYSPRLVFAADWIDGYSPLGRYEQFGELREGSFASRNAPPLLLMKMTDPFIEDLRKRLSASKDIRGMRIDCQSFGGRYLEDGSVYRIQ